MKHTLNEYTIYDINLYFLSNVIKFFTINETKLNV